ncbi:MAG TPA: PKD domain-containing protein [Baekduia sp.]|nr:PKD domain-containing protein [Baekduia sp.]
MPGLSRSLRAALLAAIVIAIVPVGAARAAAPVVVIDAPDAATTGQPVAFDGEGTTDPDGQLLSYSWAIDGQALDVENPWLSVAFAHPGTHVVALTATDSTGASATASHTVVVTGVDRLPSSLKPLGTSLAPGVTNAPELVVRVPKIRLAKRRLRVVLSCRGAERCQGTLRIVALKGRHRTPYLLTQRTFSIASGRPRVVHAPLGAKGRRRLGRLASVRATVYRGKVRTASIWGTAAYRVRVAR